MYDQEEAGVNKEKYERTELELLEFECEDVLTFSNPDDAYEGERV